MSKPDTDETTDKTQQNPTKPSHRRRNITIGVSAALVLALGTTAAIGAANGTFWGKRHVGSEYEDGLQVSDNQVIKPIGERLVTKHGKFMGSAISPDGKVLAATSADGDQILQVFSLATHKLVSTVGKGGDVKVKDASVGQGDPTFSPDGRTVALGQNTGVRLVTVDKNGKVTGTDFITLANQGEKKPLPGKPAFSADGKTLYVPVNGQNSVAAIDLGTKKVTHTWQVGIAPRAVQLVGNKLYVSNEGGRQANGTDNTMNSYGTDVPADPYLGTSTNGTLSTIDVTKPDAKVGGIRVGLHPTAMHSVGHALLVANTGSDTVSVVDTGSDKVVQTIATQPYSGAKVGYEPTGVTTTKDGHILVSLGRANALAAFTWDEKEPQEPVKYIGLLPTDYFPGEVGMAGDEVVVTNVRGIDARGPEKTIKKGFGTKDATGHATHSTTGSLTWFRMPTDSEIGKKWTNTVFHQNAWTDGNTAKSKDSKNSKAKPVPVPARVGDLSTIKHVFLIVKENRTYDQMYGDDSRGDGDPKLAQFGGAVSPNQHLINKQFGLYDNVYDIGTNSAEGHNWLMQGDDPEYTETNSGAYQRSYDTEDDVLGHQRSGFLWTSVQSAGNTVKNYGEFTTGIEKPKDATWQKYYCATKSVLGGGDAAQLTSPELKVKQNSPIPSLDKVTNHIYPQFDTDIPDIYRTQLWKQDFEKNGPANLNMLWLSSDHTGGTPDARAQVADSDLATGQIVDTISHSKYWKDSVIFVVEDDSQNGADHIDGHRSATQVISPWAIHGTVNSTYYSQINVVRTIQQILGAEPLNQKLAAATPMYDAFVKDPDYTPFTAVPNQIPLTENVKRIPACGLDKAKGDGVATAVPANMKPVAKKWEDWRTHQPFITEKEEDSVDPVLMNRFTWYNAHFFRTPYPGDSTIYTPDQVPGAGKDVKDEDDIDVMLGKDDDDDDEKEEKAEAGKADSHDHHDADDDDEKEEKGER
ncbi:bifunctional YncE family protein/alkaline phosphatase family protein [uncultured Cutibacterium sp.]|uniref:bifunctional YncE family protein/alkaline phosphatase family protein n=1 Tax=uncultured Cutibacterium sp. TaxID=1912223 RepID=UPI0028044EC9|nr:bifunctional YncE family protein/alkaline phosphatase family protein [uncultured Cutibacterium sp.]MDU1581854.1 bifunctional YncE family protein/alkaline phosphatase family protein [Cutibacterium granulosum]